MPRHLQERDRRRRDRSRRLGVGIYTGSEAWSNITANSHDFASLPLWWSSHGKPYTPLGGWTAPTLIQVKYDQKLSGIDYDLDERPLGATARSQLDAVNVTPALLDGYLGKPIAEICGNGFTNDADNHCAHFVNHVMGFDFDYTCRSATHHAPAANLRVHETFARCGRVGAWPPPADVGPCFAFVTRAEAVHLDTKTMDNIPKKHIGIRCGDMIWHYSNANRKVVRQTPDDFARHYPGPGYAMFYGEFP